MNNFEEKYIQDWDKMDLDDQLIRAIYSEGLQKPYSLQQKIIPQLLQSDNDCILQANSGVGKTHCIAIPILQKLIKNKLQNQKAMFIYTNYLLCLQQFVLIERLCQFYNEYIEEDFFKLTLIVKQDLSENNIQEQNLSYQQELLKKSEKKTLDQNIEEIKGCNIIFGTLGKIQQVFSKISNLQNIQYLSVDEADKYFQKQFNKQKEQKEQKEQKDFLQQLQNIFKSINNQCQTIFYSATFTQEQIQTFTQYDIVRSGCLIQFTGIDNNIVKKNINHNIIQYQLQNQRDIQEKKQMKFVILQSILKIFSQKNQKSIVFFSQINKLNDFYEFLINNQIFEKEQIYKINGQISPSEVLNIFNMFKNNQFNLLLATDGLVGRGIDLVDIYNVILHDIPQNIEDIIQQVGRGGRQDKEGNAYYICDQYDEKILRDKAKNCQIQFQNINYSQYF